MSFSTFQPENVALLAGAWIETEMVYLWKRSGGVALLAGAWIET